MIVAFVSTTARRSSPFKSSGPTDNDRPSQLGEWRHWRTFGASPFIGGHPPVRQKKNKRGRNVPNPHGRGAHVTRGYTRNFGEGEFLGLGPSSTPGVVGLPTDRRKHGGRSNRCREQSGPRCLPNRLPSRPTGMPIKLGASGFHLRTPLLRWSPRTHNSWAGVLFGEGFWWARNPARTSPAPYAPLCTIAETISGNPRASILLVFSYEIFFCPQNVNAFWPITLRKQVFD